jgi:DNA-binding MarR family transcriptional regulator
MSHNSTPKSLEEFNTLSCLDRVVITGTSMDFGYDKAMRGYCTLNLIDIMFVAEWARPLTDRIREFALGAACESGNEMIDCNKFKGRKDDFVKKLIKDGEYEYGKPIAVFKSMERCFSFYRSQSSIEAKLKGCPFRLRSSKCLHFYIYFIDEVLGLVCLRIQSYAPFSIQFIVNGHSILEQSLIKHKINYTKHDNCFTSVDDFLAAQNLANSITGPLINDRLEKLSQDLIPLNDIMPKWYRFTVRQIEYSTDIYTPDDIIGIDKTRQTILQLCLQKPDDFMVYLTESKRSNSKSQFNLSRTHLGICAKFHVGTLSIKAYHKLDTLLRVETSCYNLRKIRAKRTMHTKSGDTVVKTAQVTRSLKDIGLFIDFGRNANNRMLERLSILWKRSYSHKQLQSIAQKTKNRKINFSGINFFEPKDESVLIAVGSGQHDLEGFKRSDIATQTNLTPTQAGYAIRRLRAHGLVKKINGTNRYFLTKIGRSATITSRTLQQLVVTPLMAS